MSERKKVKIGFVTLGCDKNTVDTEYFAGALKEKGCDVFIADPERMMDAVIINTCSFINDARIESSAAVADWSNFKKEQNPDLKVIVVGCLPQRMGEEYLKTAEGVDLICGVGNWKETADRIAGLFENNGLIPKKKTFITSPNMRMHSIVPRYPLEHLPYSFLRISEGCNHKCSFCAIPMIKGPYVSFSKENIINVAKQQIKSGVKEINIIGQDITAYGHDLKEGYDLADLLTDLCKLNGNFKIRLLYAYPTGISDKLLQVIAENDKIVKYLDIPLQHLDPNVLKRMNRPFNPEYIFEKIKTIREKVPDIVLRTTFIVGFPGETEEAFNTLLEGIKKLKIERVGAFEYSDEDGTEAAEMKRKVSKETKRIRYDMLLKTQSKITRKFQKKQVGIILEALVELETNNPEVFFARGYMDAPEVDGGILISSEKPLKIGEYINVEITDADYYDLFGLPAEQEK